MNANQYRAAIKRLGLSQAQPAKFLGVSPRQGRRFALGEADIPLAVARLLRLMVELGLEPDHVR